MPSKHLICVVDNNPDYLLILQHFFQASLPDYNVRCFDNGETFMAELSQIPIKPRLILLDRHITTVDGHPLLVRLKQNNRSKYIPVVIMSAEATTEEIADCYEAGANSFMIKAIDSNQLRKTLTTICRYWIGYNKLSNDRE